MSELRARPLAAIDADLRACCATKRAAETELDEVSKRKTELMELEATLLVAIAAQWRRIDRLLDERARDLSAADGPLDVAGSATCPALTTVR